MHEAGLARELVEAALAAAPAAGRARITTIEVVAGEVAVPSEDALAFHVALAATGTRAAGAVLRLTRDVGEPASVRLVAVEVDEADDGDEGDEGDEGDDGDEGQASRA